MRRALAVRLGILLGGQLVSPLHAQHERSAPRPLHSDRLALELITQPWTGDFDGMVQRRRVRILTPYGKTHYFVENGVQRGIVFDFGMKMEQEINRTLKTTPATKVHVVFVPTPRNQLVASLIGGVGDIIGSNLTSRPKSRRT